MLSLTYATAKQIGIGVIIVLVLYAALTIKFATSMARKVITVLIVVGLAAAVWSQRASLQSCADQVREIGGTTRAACRFFGAEIVINEPGAPDN